MTAGPEPDVEAGDAPAEASGRRRQGDQTTRTIIQAAIDLYAENGFRGTGLMAIGERAGVAHATVLYHFKSSQALLMAVLIHSTLGMRTVILDHVHGTGGRLVTLSALYLLTAILFVLGTIVVATLQPKPGVP